MIVDVAFLPARAVPPRPARWEVALFALALAVAGLVGLTLVFAGEATYADIALAPGREPTTFRTVDETAGIFTLGRTVMPPETLLELHRGWLAYLTGRAERQPSGPPEFFTGSERAHMADVRRVFVAAQAAALAAAATGAYVAWRARRRGVLAHVLRDGAFAALVAVALVGVLAAVAFDVAFLLFHQVFFPQGNFLFASDSNLLALYPEAYFYGVTVRIGVAFVTVALVLAAAAHLSLRRRRASA